MIFKKHQLCLGSPRYRPRDSIRVSTAQHRLAGASQHYTVTPRSYYDFARRDALGRDGQGITAGSLAADVEVKHARFAAGMCTTGVLEAAVVADCRHLPVHARRRRPQAARPRRAPHVVRGNRRRTELDGAYGPQQARLRSALACYIISSRPASQVHDLLQNTAV